MATIGIVYHSMYGSTYELAQRLAEGVGKDGGEAHLRRVPELLPQSVIDSQPGVQAAIEAQADVPEATVDELAGFDGILFGSGTRFGNMTSQLRNFLDQTGPLWAQGTLVGKPAGFFTGAATMHGGHESTILTMSTFAYHHGMVIVPVGYATSQVGSTTTGGSPYGPTHLSPSDGSKQGLSDDEIAIAMDYAAYFHQVAEKLKA
jgi:NAD(P)H dehydrogenase (quinone)